MTANSHKKFLERISIGVPIIQAPMAGVSTPAMAAAVSNTGGLGSIGVGAENADGARKMINATKALTQRPFNVNVFCHGPAIPRPEVEAAWIARFQPEFVRLNSEPPKSLREIYTSFRADPDMVSLLLETKPAVVSFHFGLAGPVQIAALRKAGIVLLASATNVREAKAIVEAGLDAVIAQGYEAGGHRGVFDPSAADDKMSTFALTRILARTFELPVIAAGGIMDGSGIAAALRLGAAAALLGTAFVACPESDADAGYRAALASDAANHTIMTRAISGRPARSLPNRFTRHGETIADAEIPDYPIAYDLGKSLHAVGKARSEFGFGAQWAGQGAPLSRPMPAAELMRTLIAEMGSGA
jgi:nitronate monooxygenase